MPRHLKKNDDIAAGRPASSSLTIEDDERAAKTSRYPYWPSNPDQGRRQAHRVNTPPMSEWAESRRGYMTPQTIEMNARLHAADLLEELPAPKSARDHVGGTPFADGTPPGMAL